jgi:hypothetical protein
LRNQTLFRKKIPSGQPSLKDIAYKALQVRDSLVRKNVKSADGRNSKRKGYACRNIVSA